ncbi:tripartite tricarboxylate transporter substrate binding protein [Elioraea sp. Yellowstone]|uniref:Bug family tripartite tricarboxylate transporter substrate binding protein n=1 Tax=Elioraea sp. Yellowstone TaxID=2592070 RepID=UPI001154969C|nr:tripartite tricarboxylate transporter substrate binding protein [Elioraea sp. Yellowstone]TQF76773.1 tripartite tricarboxylate transporter substrate binding protein [Elioraea sp. Yellowstone]
MLTRRTLLATAPLAALPFAAQAQEWPSQPIRMIVPFAAGGPTDIPARLIAEEMSKRLPQRVVVENRTGAGALVGTESVAKAPKDGHTILYSTVAHAVMPSLFPRLAFDPINDFTPVALVAVVPMILIVNKDLPVNSLQELIALLKSKPGEIDYGSSGQGGAVHLASELFLAMAGVKATHVPYRGSSALMPDLLAGRIAFSVDVAASALPYVRDGRVKGLAISSKRRSSLAPDLPTFDEAGVPGYEAYTWHMVHVPAGTPQAVVARLNRVVNESAAVPEVQRRLRDLTAEVITDSTPESARAFLVAERDKWAKVIKDAGITVN